MNIDIYVLVVAWNSAYMDRRSISINILSLFIIFIISPKMKLLNVRICRPEYIDSVKFDLKSNCFSLTKPN